MGADFRFIHCADLHLGSRFKGVTRDDPELGVRMRQSVLDSFKRIVDTAVRENVDAVFISGDVYDERFALPSTRLFFVEQVSRLGNVPVFIARGNHDVVTSWDSSIPYPPNVHEFPPEPDRIVISVRGKPVEVLGISFSVQHEERDIASMLHGTDGIFTVACVHCDVDAASEGHRYASCRLTELLTRGVDYWALGHVHKRQVVHEYPHVVYAGNTQGRSYKESGEKGAYVVTVSDGRVTDMRFFATQGIIWADLDQDITGRDLNSVISELSSKVPLDGLARIRFTGMGDLDAMLRSQGDDLLVTLSQRLGCTVTEITVETSPDIDLDELAGGKDMASKVVESGRALEASGRDAIMSVILSHKMASGEEKVYSRLTDENLRAMVEEATRLVVTSMEGGR